MIDEHQLDLFDGLFWLSGSRSVVERYPSSPASISRARKRCEKAFDISISKHLGEYQLNSPSELLLRQRRVHQLARWSRDRELRLDGYPGCFSVCLSTWLPGTLYGRFDLLDAKRIHALVRDAVVDCWITVYPDVPVEDPSIHGEPLARLPLFVYALESHPLLGQSEPVQLDQLRQFPVLSYGTNLMPRITAQLAPLFQKLLIAQTKPRQDIVSVVSTLWANPEALIVATEPEFATAPRHSGMVTRPVGIQLPVAVEYHALVHQRYATHQRFSGLMHALRERLNDAHQRFPSLEVLR